MAGPLFSAALLACTPSWSTRAQRPWSLRKRIGSPDRGQSQRLLSLQNQERILIDKTDNNNKGAWHSICSSQLPEAHWR